MNNHKRPTPRHEEPHDKRYGYCAKCLEERNLNQSNGLCSDCDSGR